MKYNFLLNISKYLVIFFPVFLISGPFLTDFFGSLLGILTFTFILLKKKSEYINNRYFYFFILIFICLNLSSLFSIEPIISLKSSTTYLRLILFIFAISYLFNNFVDLPEKIYKIYFLSILILLLDSFLIIKFNFNIFGMQIDGSSSRIRSLFDDEEIMGSFVSRTLPLIFGLTYYLKIKNLNKINLIMVISATFLILVSGERTALANLFIFIFFLIIMERKFFFQVCLFGVIIFIIIFQFKKESIDRIIFHTFEQSNIGSGKFIIFSLRHSIHYYTAFEIFKDYPTFGAGIKSFRKLCSKDKYFEKFKRNYKEEMEKQSIIDGCNTHPHHIYFQFLSETGIIIFGLFFTIFIYITYNLFELFKRSISENLSLTNKANYFFMVTIFISMFPLLPSGNYFNNWYLFINYLPIGFYLANKLRI